MPKTMLDQSVLSYYLYRLAGFLAPRIPPHLGYRLAEPVGELLYRFPWGARASVRDNITHVLGPSADVERVVRRVFHNIAKNYYDLFRLPALSRAQIERLVRIEGWEHIERALAKGKGLIFVSAHFGNVDLVSQVFALRGIPVTIPVEHLKPEALYRYVCGLRESKGIRLIPVDGPLLGLYRALRRGEVVGLAADRDITESGIVINFFGAPARLPDGHVRLALRTGAPIVMGFSRRLPDNTFVAYLESPLELETSGDRARDVRAGLEKVARVMERFIVQWPDQWVMTYPIWREA